MDEYHLRLGYDVLHICQLAEMLERGGGTCRPEPLITEERSAWDLSLIHISQPGKSETG